MMWSELCRWAFDGLMLAWFFRPMEPQRSCPRLGAVLGAAILLPLLPIYLWPGESGVLHLLFRFILRGGIYALWLICRKGVTPAKAVYFAVMCWACFTMENNIFLTPQLSILRWEQFTLTPYPLLDAFLAKAFELLLEFLFLTLASRTLMLKEPRSVDASRIGVIVCISSCELYIKHTLKILSATPMDTLHWEFTSYPILLQVLLLAALLFSERYFISREQREQEQPGEKSDKHDGPPFTRSGLRCQILFTV